jgi:ribonuclease J
MKINFKDCKLAVTPLGGVGEIGSNMTVFETEDERIIVDYGILFPYENFFDINYLIVNLDDFDKEKPTTLFFTPGHEDHIGAAVHIIKELPNAKMYAPEFAAKLLSRKFDDANIPAKVNIYVEDDYIKLGEFELHPIHVTHSIPHTFGLIIKDRLDAISMLFISDFKYDLNPLYENPFNIEKVKTLFNLSEKRYCFLDSTNILSNKRTLSERDLLDDLDEIFKRKQRTFITLFSSNIWRLRTFFELAKKNGKKIIPVGRSLFSYLDAAKDCGLIELDSSVYREADQLNNHNADDLVILLTGCQGDHFGALRRVTSGEHKYFKPTDKDIFVFSSKSIPGNEKKVSRICNEIALKGAEIITANEMQIHASGHPGQKDLIALLSEINPTHYIPIHGEVFFLNRHIEFIKKNTKAEPILMKNFDSLCIKNDLSYSIQNQSATEPKIIHSKGLEIEREKISERRKMACNGSIFVSVSRKKRVLTLTHKGLPTSIDDYEETFLGILSDYFFGELKNKDDNFAGEKLRIKTRKTYDNILGYKPIVSVHIL